MVIIYRVFLKGFPIFRYQYLPCFMELKLNYTIWYIRFHRSIEHLWIEIIKIDTRICHFNIKFRQSYICYRWSYLKFHGDPILSDHWLIIFCYVYFLHLLRDEMINPMKPIILCKISRKNKGKWKNFTFIAKWFVKYIYTFILFHSQLGTSLWKFLTIVHNILTLWS